jgi:zinc protease
MILKDHSQLVIIGKASKIKNQVKKYGALTEIQIKAEGF